MPQDRTKEFVEGVNGAFNALFTTVPALREARDRHIESSLENSPANVQFKNNDEGIVIMRGDPRGASDDTKKDRAFNEGFTPAVLAYDTPWQNASGYLAALTGFFGTPVAVNKPGMDDVAVNQERLATLLELFQAQQKLLQLQITAQMMMENIQKCTLWHQKDISLHPNMLAPTN